jgi:hypothetical protein
MGGLALLRPRSAVVGLIVGLAVFLGFAEAAAANHIAGATYSGTHTGGGNVLFEVSPDGTRITRFRVENVPGPGGCMIIFREIFSAGDSTPINNHSFSYQSSDTQLSGSFPQPQQASGSFQGFANFPGGCNTFPTTWTASTQSQPPGGGGGPGGGPGGGGPGGGAPQYDLQGPNAALFGPRVQKAGPFVRVGVGCRDEPCNALAQGTVIVPNRFLSRRFRLRPARARGIPAGVRRTLRLRVPRRALRGIRRALRARRRIAVRVTVTFTDAAGNRTIRRRTIRLRR